MSDQVCVVNIGPRGRRQRVGVGVAMMLVVAAGVILFSTQDLPRVLRLAFAVPLFVGGLGFFQAQAGTWVVLASRGARDLDDGEESIEDENVRSTLRAQARSVYIRSALFAVAGTAVLLALPL